MVILALDTTTRSGSVAVVRGDDVLALLPGDESRTHGERLPAEIAAALAEAGVTRDEVDLLAVAAGPGGFTGLRIGIAAMQGLAMTLRKPVAGVSALDALAAQASGTAARFVVPWMDAQRGDVFATLVEARSGVVVEAAVADSPARVLEQWRAHLQNQHALFIGDAVARDAATLDAAGGGRWERRTPTPLAPQIAALGAALAAQGKAGPPHALVPVYVRRSDAEIDRDNRRPKAGPERHTVEERGGR